MNWFSTWSNHFHLLIFQVLYSILAWSFHDISAPTLGGTWFINGLIYSLTSVNELFLTLEYRNEILLVVILNSINEWTRSQSVTIQMKSWKTELLRIYHENSCHTFVKIVRESFILSYQGFSNTIASFN